MNDHPRSRISGYRRPIGYLLAAYWTALFVATHMPPPDLSSLPKDTDKFLHVVCYAGLAYLLGLWKSASRPLTAGVFAWVFVVVATYAVVDEVLQIPINRKADTYDALADMVGALIGLAALKATQMLLAGLWSLGDGAEREA